MRNKAGRPKMAKSKAKGLFVAARFTPSEAKQIDSAVEVSGETKSAWVRKTLLSAADKINVQQ